MVSLGLRQRDPNAASTVGVLHLKLTVRVFRCDDAVDAATPEKQVRSCRREGTCCAVLELPHKVTGRVAQLVYAAKTVVVHLLCIPVRVTEQLDGTEALVPLGFVAKFRDGSSGSENKCLGRCEDAGLGVVPEADTAPGAVLAPKLLAIRVVGVSLRSRPATAVLLGEPLLNECWIPQADA
jgi:hypothetical protein